MLLRAAAARLRPRAASARLCTAASDAAVHLAEVQAKNEALQAQLDARLEELRELKFGSKTSVTEPPEVSKFVGARGAYTTDLHFHRHDKASYDHNFAMPCFRLIDDIGRVQDGAVLPEMERELAMAIMAQMIRVAEFDKIFNDAQRQGRISFYLTSRGEEACSVACAAALDPTDWLLPQYREIGACFWRGLTFDSVADQLCANALDRAHGRQLPLHIGGAKEHIVYIKSTLGTQCPHAAGAAYAMKMQGREQVAVAFFGEGCASEGDVPSAFNVSAVHGCPTIFFCRNNGCAASRNARPGRPETARPS
jgi:2-oxoisovalerate dehydrogenase E1 component alpha subunit